MPVIYPLTWRDHLNSSSVLIATFAVAFIFINDHIRQLTAFSTHDCDRGFKIMLFERGGNHKVACDLGAVVVVFTFCEICQDVRTDTKSYGWNRQLEARAQSCTHTHMKGNCLEFYLFMLVFYHSWHLMSVNASICPSIFSSSSSGLWGCWSLLLHALGRRYTCQCITGRTDTDENVHTLMSIQSFNFTHHVFRTGGRNRGTWRKPLHTLE